MGDNMLHALNGDFVLSYHKHRPDLVLKKNFHHHKNQRWLQTNNHVMTTAIGRGHSGLISVWMTTIWSQDSQIQELWNIRTNRCKQWILVQYLVQTDTNDLPSMEWHQNWKVQRSPTKLRKEYLTGRSESWSNLTGQSESWRNLTGQSKSWCNLTGLFRMRLATKRSCIPRQDCKQGKDHLWYIQK
mgnify:CR=1 FL=1